MLARQKMLIDEDYIAMAMISVMKRGMDVLALRCMLARHPIGYWFIATKSALAPQLFHWILAPQAI